jgi:glycosyltransferase involved in cell wall biosynthesis
MSSSSIGKQLCIVDPAFTLDSPTMKHLVYAIPSIRAAGWQITVIAERIQPDLSVDFVPLGLRYRNPVMGSFELPVVANRATRIYRGQNPTAIVFGTPGLPSGADVSAVQFLHHVWLSLAPTIPHQTVRERVALALSRFRDKAARRDFASGHTHYWLPVSDSIADELRKLVSHPERVRVLPNSYDETRFTVETVTRFRTARRIELGYSDSDYVFGFLSQGHYQRKGFWIAVSALAKLRHRRDSLQFAPKLLVIGGLAPTLQRLRKTLTKEFSDWPDWIQFTGMLSRPEETLSAIDAFLFPSYFEAFCLAEIEAAALSLPLLLTPHFGSEMILKPGENGLSVSFSPDELAEQLWAFLRGSTKLGPIETHSHRPQDFRPSVGKALNRKQFAERLLQILEETWIAKKES